MLHIKVNIPVLVHLVIHKANHYAVQCMFSNKMCQRRSCLCHYVYTCR